MQAFDYIIVGGGAAGCILASRLSESPDVSVLLLEAGGAGRGFWVDIPAGFSKLLNHPRFNWRFRSEPEPNVRERRIAIPRGKGLGGSTLINGMIYVRGQPRDYDAWERAGARGWGWRGVEPYFRRLERTDVGGPARGRDGPMHIAEVAERFPLSEAFIAAGREAGLPANPDYNDGDQAGVGYYQVLQRDGRRWSVRDGYLSPARSRPNLTVRTGAHATGLVLEGRRCTGVTYRDDAGGLVTVGARRQVVLAAGAVQSPQLLELSGIGDPRLLAEAGLPLRHALPGVGANYIDHYATRMNWRVQGSVTLNEMSRGWRLGRAVAQYALHRRGILTLGTGLAFGFARTLPDLPTPDIQYFFVHASYANAAERILDRAPGMTLGVAQLRPASAGSIHAHCPDPLAAPRIRPNLLSHPDDQACLVRGMQLARRIMAQPAMRRYAAFEMAPGDSVRTPAQWLDFARDNGQTIYHPVGTCRMGEDDGAVVDSRLRVRGLEGLSVADASVMPAMVSGNTQAAAMMIAEKAADLLRQPQS